MMLVARESLMWPSSLTGRRDVDDAVVRTMDGARVMDKYSNWGISSRSPDVVSLPMNWG